MIELKVEEGSRYTHLYLFDTDTNGEAGHISVNEGGHITGLEVFQKYQHKGFGSRLLTEAEIVAKNKYGITRISLSCFDHRLSFYLDRGYICKSASRVLNEMVKRLREEEGSES